MEMCQSRPPTRRRPNDGRLSFRWGTRGLETPVFVKPRLRLLIEARLFENLRPGIEPGTAWRVVLRFL